MGSTEETTILDLARKILALVDKNNGNESQIKFVPYENAYTKGFEDMRRRVPDITKIKNAIGWEPKRDLDEILKDVINFYLGKTPNNNLKAE